MIYEKVQVSFRYQRAGFISISAYGPLKVQTLISKWTLSFPKNELSLFRPEWHLRHNLNPWLNSPEFISRKISTRPTRWRKHQDLHLIPIELHFYIRGLVQRDNFRFDISVSGHFRFDISVSGKFDNPYCSTIM